MDAPLQFQGRAAAKLDVAVTDIRAAAGATVQSTVADVTDEADVAPAVGEATTITGGLDVLVAVAGGWSGVSPITQIDLQQWRDTIEVNVTGTTLAIKYGARPMARAGGGAIVGVSSIASSNTHRWFGAYGVAKAGIDHLCRLAADELGASGIRLNCVRPTHCVSPRAPSAPRGRDPRG